MAKRQQDLLRRFKEVFEKKYRSQIAWHEGQSKENRLPLPKHTRLRRGGIIQRNEDIEFGDLRADLDSHTLIVEYEDGAISIHNLVKYWPYIRSELVLRPELPILLCHFSDWSTYGSHRDLWQWVQAQMAAGPHRSVNILCRQFDNGGKLKLRAENSVKAASSWILSRITAR